MPDNNGPFSNAMVCVDVCVCVGACVCVCMCVEKLSLHSCHKSICSHPLGYANNTGHTHTHTLLTKILFSNSFKFSFTIL